MLSQPARIRASPVCDRFHGHALPGRLRVPGQLFHWVPTTKAPPALATYRGLAYTSTTRMYYPAETSSDKARQEKKKRTVDHNTYSPPLPCTADIIPSHSSSRSPKSEPCNESKPCAGPTARPLEVPSTTANEGTNCSRLACLCSTWERLSQVASAAHYVHYARAPPGVPKIRRSAWPPTRQKRVPDA